MMILKADLTSTIESVSTPYILIVTGSHASGSKHKRQEDLNPSKSSTYVGHSSTSIGSPSNNNDTKIDGPLLERVQLLTTPIITGLLVTFLLLLPILYVGISALAGIQVPPRMMEIAKSTNVSKDRKDQ